MTSQELKTKLDASLEKVSKRKATIEKICKKLGINANDLFKKYEEVASGYTDSYLPSKVCDSIVFSFTPYKDTYDGMSDDDYWSTCEYNEKVSQLSDNLVKLHEVELVANGWQVKYDIQKNKEDAPKIEALWAFLCNWEQSAIEYYHENASRYFELKKGYEDALNKFKKDHNIDDNTRGSYSMIERFKSNYFSGIDSLTTIITEIKYKYVYPNPNDRYDYKYVPDTYTVDEEYLAKTIAQEKLAKYEDLCNRISAYVGEIIDVKGLRIGAKGTLDGIVIGTKGKAKIETIGAGGWNIMCFHHRVLVHKID